MKLLNVNINGNKKLKNNENVRFMIWNLPAVKTCPFRTAHCEQFCYARKAEKCYPTCLPCREDNYLETLSPDFVKNMIYTIEKKLNSKAFQGKKCVFRIHESGDFYNPEYAEKWIAICDHFKDDSRIIFLAYTKSVSYFLFRIGYTYEKRTLPENLIIRASVWDDTTDSEFAKILKGEFPIYTAFDKATITEMQGNGEQFHLCRCDDCATCGKCWDGSEKLIICEIH